MPPLPPLESLSDGGDFVLPEEYFPDGDPPDDDDDGESEGSGSDDGDDSDDGGGGRGDGDHDGEDLKDIDGVGLENIAGESSKRASDSLQSRRFLPKINYPTLVVLSLSNFLSYRECIETLGYAREWPSAFFKPTVKDLDFYWDTPHGYKKFKRFSRVFNVCRKEAFLVISQTIGTSLKYLLKGIKKGDVWSLWRALYGRFLHFTQSSIKERRQEWENLSMEKLNLQVDEFISHVVEKAEELRLLGETISEKDEAIALVCGLSDRFSFLKQSCAVTDNYDWVVICQAATTLAVDQKLFRTKTLSGKDFSKISTSKSEKFCLNFNLSKGCSAQNCKWPHVKVKKSKVLELKEAVDARREKRLASTDKALNIGKAPPKTFDRKCFKCGDPNHLSNVCPLKDKINTYIKSIKKGESGEKKESSFVLPVFVTFSGKGEWLLDCGASQHVTNDWSSLSDPVLLGGETVFTVGNDQRMIPTHSGNVSLCGVTLTDVFFCKECPVNLVSEGRLLLAGVTVVKNPSTKEANVLLGEVLLMKAPLIDGLFPIQYAHDGVKGLVALNR